MDRLRHLPTISTSTSRRTALVAGLAVGLGAVPVAAAPDAPGAGALPIAVQGWLDAYRRRDGEAMAALYADDGVFEDVPNAFVARGSDIGLFANAAVENLADVRIVLRSALHGTTWAVIEYEVHAANGGDTVGARPGASFVSRVVTIFELAGDRIVRSSDYYDKASILAQLGVLPLASLAGQLAP